VDADFEARANALIAQSDGRIWIESGDRDSETQQRLWDEAVIKYGPEEARNWVAPPGHSNHEKGIAIDFGGDMTLLAQLAPQFGLYQPMSWEPWHWEPLGSRDKADPLAYTEKPVNPSALVSQTQTRDYADVMQQVLNIKPFQPAHSSADIIFRRGGTDPIIAPNPAFLSPELMKIFGPLDQLLTPGPSVNIPGMGKGTQPSNISPVGNTDIDRFMYALRSVESSHNYKAVGVATPWGTAKGAYQYLDSTWDGYGGYASADLAPPEVQDEKARQDMQRYYDEYGSWDSVSAAWYSGPGGNWQSQEVQEYVGKVNANL
jgi:hypothetical protein